MSTTLTMPDSIDATDLSNDFAPELLGATTDQAPSLAETPGLEAEPFTDELAGQAGDETGEQPEPAEQLPEQFDKVEKEEIETSQSAPMTPEYRLYLMKVAEREIRKAESYVSEMQAELKSAKKEVEYRVARLREIAGGLEDEESDSDEQATDEQVETVDQESDSAGDDESQEESSDDQPSDDDDEFGTPTRLVMTQDVGESAKEGETFKVISIDDEGDPVIEDTGGDRMFLNKGEYEYIEWDTPKPAAKPIEESKPPAVEDESWKEVRLESLDIPPGSIKLLAEASLETVGQLAAFTESNQLADVKGIGSGKATAIEDAMEEFWATR